MKEKSAVGVWLNRLSLVSLELGFEHEIETNDDGTWGVTAVEEGKLVARFANGEQRPIDLRVGDTVVATPTEVYVGLAESRTPRRVKPKQRKPAARAARGGGRR